MYYRERGNLLLYLFDILKCIFSFGLVYRNEHWGLATAPPKQCEAKPSAKAFAKPFARQGHGTMAAPSDAIVTWLLSIKT